jgi:hypothetical protein
MRVQTSGGAILERRDSSRDLYYIGCVSEVTVDMSLSGPSAKDKEQSICKLIKARGITVTDQGIISPCNYGDTDLGALALNFSDYCLRGQ